MREKEKKQEETLKGTINIASGQIGAFTARFNSASTDAMIEGMDVFRALRDSIGSNDKGHGNLFEAIEAAKFNADAARKNSNLNAQVSAHPTCPQFVKDVHSKADILIHKDGNVVREVQAKCYDRNSTAAVKLADRDYNGMQRLVPKDRESEVRRLTEKGAKQNNIYKDGFKDVKENLSGELKHENVCSGGTTYEEAVFARNYPKTYAALSEIKYVGKEAGNAGAGAAVGGMVIGGAISSVQNGYKVFKGELEATVALTNIAKDGVKAGAKSGVTGATGAVIRYGANKAGLSALAKSNITTAIAAGMIDCGVVIYRFVKGEISSEECMIKLGHNGFSTTNGILVGAGAGALFGVGAAIIGSVAGYMLASAVYHSTVAILQNAKLAQKEAERVKLLCEQAITNLRKQREEFTNNLDAKLKKFRSEFYPLLDSLDVAIQLNDFGTASGSLVDFAVFFGRKLQFANFQEFDEFMTESKESLCF